MPFTISDLRQCPEFFDTVADADLAGLVGADGHPLDLYHRPAVARTSMRSLIPFALVAHDGAMNSSAPLR